MANRKQDDLIIIGVDFGTIFLALHTEKTSTKLCYEEGSGEMTWGYEVAPDKEAIKWFKLLLIEPKDVPGDIAASTHFKEARNMQKRLAMNPAEITGTFLRYLWNHSVDSINRTVGADLVDACQFHVVVTLPAIWPAYAQERMATAVKLSEMLDPRPAGQTTVRFISEPEAAALATLKDVSNRSTIKATLIVCDAGGSTADLISYEIQTRELFVVKECVEGDGALCGGVFVDEEFLNLIKKKVTPEAWENVDEFERQKLLNNEWEHCIKPQFQNKPREWVIDLPNSCEASPNSRQKERGTRRSRRPELTVEDILEAFLPVTKKIESLFKSQATAIRERCEKSLKYIILVGGFGRSRYLYHCIEDVAKPFGSAVLQSRRDRSWSAICRGAVIQGLTDHDLSEDLSMRVRARKARASIGVLYSATFDPTRHLHKEKQRDLRRHEWRVREMMMWSLKQGEDISDYETVTKNFSKLFKHEADVITKEILISKASPPPVKRNDSVQKLCTINWNHDVDVRTLPEWRNKLGKAYRRLDYCIEMTCEECTVDFAIYHNGTEVGCRNIEVEFDGDTGQDTLGETVETVEGSDE